MVAPFFESEQLGSQIRPSDTDVETGQPRVDVPTVTQPDTEWS